jgi:hypothetical protein
MISEETTMLTMRVTSIGLRSHQATCYRWPRLLCLALL